VWRVGSSKAELMIGFSMTTWLMRSRSLLTFSLCGLGVIRAAEIIQQGLPGLLLLEVGEVLPFLGLSLLDEGNHILREQAALRVERISVAFFVPARRCQVVFNGGLECMFRVLTWPGYLRIEKEEDFAGSVLIPSSPRAWSRLVSSSFAALPFP